MLLLTLRKVSSILLVCCLQIANADTVIIGVDGSNNILNITQSGAGSHSVDVNLYGNDHTAEFNQQGDYGHDATVDLYNDGGAWNFTLNQTGVTADTYTGGGTCYAAAGCSATINR